MTGKRQGPSPGVRLIKASVKRELTVLQLPINGLKTSLRASSPFGGYREKYTRERHARGDATAGGGEEKGRACNRLS